jgi:RHS repeat-associated protein
MTDYGYNDLMHRSWMAYPDVSDITINYKPNGFGEPTEARVYNGNTVELDFANNAEYHPNGMIQSFTYGNGVTHSMTLDPTSQLPDQLLDTRTSGDIVNLTYGFDNNSNVTSISDGVDGRYSLNTLVYDGLDRLTNTYGGSGIGKSTIDYDGFGNITSYSSKIRSLDYTYNYTINRLTRVSGVSGKYSSIGYDNKGNITNNGKYDLTFNEANQVSTANGFTYQYDGFNRRVYQSDNGGSFSVYTQDGTLIYREKGNTISGDGVSYIYLGKKLIAKYGDVEPATSVDASRQYYRPYGETIGEPKDDVGYTGHKFDKALGLSYMQARYYDPVIGRFYSNDPVGYTSANPVMSFNRYMYVNNNPYKYTDPNGEFLDIVLDVGFILYDLGDMAVNGVNDTNSASLAANVAGALIPGATGLGLAARAGKASKKACCFVAGTQVLTEDGYKSIEEVKLGEKLWAKDVETGEQDWKPVVKIFNEPDRGIYEIKLEGKDGFSQKIEATDDHPFYVVGKGWKTTIELTVGDQIETDGNGSMKVVSVVDEKRQALTYNFTVADFHTYYVTKKNVLVHNCGIKMKETNKPDATRVNGDPSQAVAEAGYDKAKLSCAKCKLETSIKNRKAEQKRKGPDAGHAKKIKTEQKQLDKVNRRLKEVQ